MKLKSKLKKILISIVAFILVLGAWYLYACNSGDTTIIISKATTYITEPLDENGDVDFIAYFNRNKVPAESNIIAGLWEAIERSRPVDREFDTEAAAYFDLLGITPKGLESPPRDPLTHFDPPDYPELEGDSGFFRSIDSAPWKRDRSPRMDKFIQFHKKRIQRAIEAFSRAELFEPEVKRSSWDGGDSGLGLLQKTIGPINLLLCREFEDRPEESTWEDILNIRRGLRRANSGDSWTLLALRGIDRSVASTGAHLAQHSGSLQALEDYARETLALQGFQRSPQQSLSADRVSLVSETIDLLRDGSFWESPSSTVGFKSIVETLGSGSCDWNRILTRVNERYDELLAFAALPLSERDAAFTRLRQASASRRDEIKFLSALLFVSVRTDMVAEQLYERDLSSFLRKLKYLENSRQDVVNEIALHLAVFKLKNGNYPSKLEELPVQLPTGPYAQELPEYVRTDEGFSLWSFGADGRKDMRNGRYVHEDDYRVMHPVVVHPRLNFDLPGENWNVKIFDGVDLANLQGNPFTMAIRVHRKRIADLQAELKEFELTHEHEDGRYESRVSEFERKIRKLSERVGEFEHWARDVDSANERAKADAAADADDSNGERPDLKPDQKNQR